MKPILSEQQITPFVREVLGCQCPLELFEKIDSSIERLGDLTYQRILVGQRLLVYLVYGDNFLDAPECVVELLNAGVAERDREGYNRIRLVLQGELSLEQAAGLNALVSPVTTADAKAHLHLVDVV